MTIPTAPLWPVRNRRVDAENHVQYAETSEGLPLIAPYFPLNTFRQFEQKQNASENIYWRALNNRREDWHYDASQHPLSPLAFNRDTDDRPHCPYCDAYDNDYSVDFSDETNICPVCDQTYSIEIELFEGITSSPIECHYHDWVFADQYYIGPETSKYFAVEHKPGHNLRRLICIECGAQDYYQVEILRS